MFYLCEYKRSKHFLKQAIIRPPNNSESMYVAWFDWDKGVIEVIGDIV